MKTSYILVLASLCLGTSQCASLGKKRSNRTDSDIPPPQLNNTDADANKVEPDPAISQLPDSLRNRFYLQRSAQSKDTIYWTQKQALLTIKSSTLPIEQVKPSLALGFYTSALGNLTGSLGGTFDLSNIRGHFRTLEDEFKKIDPTIKLAATPVSGHKLRLRYLNQMNEEKHPELIQLTADMSLSESTSTSLTFQGSVTAKGLEIIERLSQSAGNWDEIFFYEITWQPDGRYLQDTTPMTVQASLDCVKLEKSSGQANGGSYQVAFILDDRCHGVLGE